MSDDPDFEYLIVDSTIIRAHQHASGAKKGGLKTPPHALTALMRLAKIESHSGNLHGRWLLASGCLTKSLF
jgi:hypothetical protein